MPDRPLGRVSGLWQEEVAQPGVVSATDRQFAFVFAADENFVLGVAVALHSALVKLPHSFAPEIYVLDTGLSEDSRVRLLRVVHMARRWAKLTWIRIPPERLEGLPTYSYTIAAYSRLLVPELLPLHIRRVVYLDADIMVRRDVSPLFGIDLAGTPLGAVWAVAPDNVDRRSSAVHGGARAEFNTGVLVMDLEGWRRTGLGERALQYAAASSSPLVLQDQAALNAVTDKWFELDCRWNFQHTILFWKPPPLGSSEVFCRLYNERRDLYRSAAVLHFVGAKPWEPWCMTPGTMAWVRAMMRTGWYSRREGQMWLLRWLGRRLRFWAGTTKRRWWARLSGEPDATLAP